MNIAYVTLINTVTLIHFTIFSLFLLFSRKSSHISNKIFAFFLMSEALAIANYLVSRNGEFFYIYFPHMFLVFSSAASYRYPSGNVGNSRPCQTTCLSYLRRSRYARGSSTLPVCNGRGKPDKWAYAFSPLSLQ